MDTNIPIGKLQAKVHLLKLTYFDLGKSAKLKRKVGGAAAVFLRILGRKAAGTKWRMACLSENISNETNLSMQEYLNEFKESFIAVIDKTLSDTAFYRQIYSRFRTGRFHQKVKLATDKS